MTPTRRHDRIRRPALVVVAAASVLLALAGCSASAGTSPAGTAPVAPAASPAATAAASPSASPAGGIVKEEWGVAAPSTAPGQELGLWHYTIAPGAQLVPHSHPGWQIARIAAGTLTYSIVGGDVTVTRANGAAEAHRAGETIELAAGDTVVEDPDAQHYGSNRGTTAVELYTATLFDADQPSTITLPTPTPSPS